MTEAAQLREDEPHPVASLPPALSSASTISNIGACAATKRSRLKELVVQLSAPFSDVAFCRMMRPLPR